MTEFGSLIVVLLVIAVVWWLLKKVLKLGFLIAITIALLIGRWWFFVQGG